MFEGTLTALVTPFRDGGVDEEALRSLVDTQIDAGIDGLVPCGSTGESATLSHEEHRRVIEIVLEAANGRIPVVAGTGSNNTQEAIELTRHAQEAGATGALLISPYYNKPTQEGIIAHYEGRGECNPLPADSLQHPWTYRVEYPACDRGPDRREPLCGGDQGSLGRSRADVAGD